MTKETKVWVVSRREGDIWQVHYDKSYAEDVVKRLRENDSKIDYKLIELAPNSEPEKIKMTQAVFDEFETARLKNIGNYVHRVLADIIDDEKYSQLKKWLIDANETFKSDKQKQAEFAHLWASDNPAELVEIEKEKQYYLVSKLDKDFGVEDFPFGINLTGHKNQFGKFTDGEIEEMGGDDWLAEMGLTAVEVTE